MAGFSSEATVNRRFDLLLRGGHLVDPAQGTDGVRDIAVEGGRVAAVDHRIPEDSAHRVINLAGRYVTPGFIDVHAHLYGPLGVDPDVSCLPHGATANVDAGGTGSGAFDGCKALLASRRSRAFCFVNLSRIGLIGVTKAVGTQIGELANILYADPDGVIQILRENPDLVVGPKVLLSEHQTGRHGPISLWVATRVARETGTRLMVHIGDATMPLPEILDQLAPGDIVSHCYTGLRYGVLDARGKLLPGVVPAAERGIVFDVAHGRTAFSFKVAQAALAQGFLPTTISSDLSRFNMYVVHDLPTTMSKFLALGLSVCQVVEQTTINAARTLGRERELGSLAPGRTADIAAFEVEEGQFEFVDAYGDTMAGRKRIKPALTVLGGEVVFEAA